MKLIIDIDEEIKAVIDKNGTNEIVAETLWQAVKNGTPIPDNVVTWVDFEHLRDKIIRLSCRYSIARERGCSGQVEWSDRLIKQEDVLKTFEEYQKGGKE